MAAILKIDMASYLRRRSSD